MEFLQEFLAFDYFCGTFEVLYEKTNHVRDIKMHKVCQNTFEFI